MTRVQHEHKLEAVHRTVFVRSVFQLFLLGVEIVAPNLCLFEDRRPGL
jgi:hypothetical protein